MSEIPVSDSVAERRRAIFDRLKEKFRGLGTPIDTRAEFVALYEEWIAGRMEMAEVARLIPMRLSRKAERAEPADRSDPQQPEPMSDDQLISELDRIIGTHEL